MAMMKDWKYFLVIPAALLFLPSFAQNLPEKTNRPDTVQIPSRVLSDSPGPPGIPGPLALPVPKTPFVIGNIIVTGNKKTKKYIIERELSFKPGDTLFLSDLVIAFQLAHDRIFNTRLFNEVIVYLKGFRGYQVDIEIDVKERWYIFPLPYFKPVDRNLTAWAQKNYKLNRVNYGAKFTHHNFTGRNDNLTAWLITGYARQLELYYNQPYADKSLKHGFGIGFSFAEVKELDAYTAGNQQGFINADTISYAGKYLSRQFSFSLRYFYRPGLRVRHFAGFKLVDVKIDSVVRAYNPHYFDNGQVKAFYPEFAYSYNYTDVDYVAYPLNGIVFETGLVRRGINKDMNLWQGYTRLIRSWPLANKLWFGIQNSNILKLPLRQPFYNQQLLGYGDLYLRGLDKYVVDGTAGIVVRNTLYRELLNFSIPLVRGSAHDHIPFRIFATAFNDYGYVYNQDFRNNSLVNRFLYTGGLGIDIVTFYDLTFKFDYSINQLGQKGLFLHIRNDF